ncbi:hypothetical protein WJX77_003550 [Trebouxia sp. C0004]
MQRGSRRQKPSMASDRPGAALSAVFIVPLCPGLAAAARPLEEQQQQHVAPAGLNLTALVVLIEHFVFAYGYNCAVLMLSEHPAGRRLQQVFGQASAQAALWTP